MRKLESNKNTNIEEITPTKYTKISITAPELAQPAPFLFLPVHPTHPHQSFCLLTLPTYLHQLLNAFTALLLLVDKITNYQKVRKIVYY